MPFIVPTPSRTFDNQGVVFTGLASPAAGSRENAAWTVAMAPATPGLPHQVTREEIFVCTAGRALAEIDGQSHELSKGSALVVPAHTTFSLGNPFGEPFEAVVVLPVGGQAVIGGQAFTPPWAA